MGLIYAGRFAPSPTGPLHAGSMVAALASWLDARVHGGRWLVRIEDIDTPRCMPGASQTILSQLAACALLPDEPPVYQSQRHSLYQEALDRLIETGWSYPCACTRQDIALALTVAGHPHERHGELIYPGTCRQGLNGKPARSWRFNVEGFKNRSVHNANPVSALNAMNSLNVEVQWGDRLLGRQSQDVGRDVGDFILKRADGFWAYQLAVVIDDAAQGITHIVRGQDLADNTARQILLQQALGLPLPRYLHTPLVLGANGEKLSKQNGAQAVDMHAPLKILQDAGDALDLNFGLGKAIHANTPEAWLKQALVLWSRRLKLAGD